MFKLALQIDIHPCVRASLQMQAEHRCGYCVGNHIFARKLNKVLSSCLSRHNIYLLDLGGGKRGERGEWGRERERERGGGQEVFRVGKDADPWKLESQGNLV